MVLDPRSSLTFSATITEPEVMLEDFRTSMRHRRLYDPLPTSTLHTYIPFGSSPSEVTPHDPNTTPTAFCLAHGEVPVLLLMWLLVITTVPCLIAASKYSTHATQGRSVLPWPTVADYSPSPQERHGGRCVKWLVTIGKLREVSAAL